MKIGNIALWILVISLIALAAFQQLEIKVLAGVVNVNACGTVMQDKTTRALAGDINSLCLDVQALQTQLGQFVAVQSGVNKDNQDVLKAVDGYTKNNNGAWDRQEEVNKQYGERLNLLTSALQGR